MYRKGTVNNIHTRIRKQWLRAEKKRRAAKNRLVREVADRLLGRQQMVHGEIFANPRFVGEDGTFPNPRGNK